MYLQKKDGDKSGKRGKITQAGRIIIYKVTINKVTSPTRTLTESCNIMKRLSLIALTFAMPWAVMAQTTVFNDTFTVPGSDTLNTTTITAPGTSYTTWEMDSTKNAFSSSITSGNLRLTLAAATCSQFTEMQALFTSSPVTLATTGDYIDLEVVFVDTSGTLLTGTGSFLYDGLYNANQVAPLAQTGAGLGMANGGLATTTTYSAGGAKNWQGFVGRLGSTSTTAATANNISARRPQTGTTSGNQSVLANNASNGLGNTPSNDPVGGSAAGVNQILASGQTYTLYLQVLLTATGETMTSSLYSGTGIGGTLLGGTTGSVLSSSTADYETTFDALGIGMRHANPSVTEIPLMDISQVEVITDISPVPEPVSVVLLGFGALTLALSRRRMRR